MPNKKVFLSSLEASFAINLESGRGKSSILSASSQPLLLALDARAFRERIVSDRTLDKTAHEVFVDLSAPHERLVEKTSALLTRGVPAITLSGVGNGPAQLDAEGRSVFEGVVRLLSLSAETAKVVERGLVDLALKLSSSPAGLVRVTTVFTHLNRDVARLPLDLVTRERNSALVKLSARFASRDDWLRAIRAVPHDGASIKEKLTLPFATFAKFAPMGAADPKLQWVMSPEAEWTDRLIDHLKAALREGYPVSCTVRNALTKKSISFPVDAVESRGRMKRHGLYLKPGHTPKIADLIGRPASPASPVLAPRRVNAHLLWARKATHVAAPLKFVASRRQAFALTAQEEKRLHAEIVSGTGAATLPVIELKTSVYRFYLDVDLNNALIGSWAPGDELKKAQREFFAGENLSYGRLSGILGRLFPVPSSEVDVLVSTRRPHTSHEGHHIVFPGVLLRNDGVSGYVVARHLEAVAARVLLQHTRNPIVRFLCQALVDDALSLVGRGTPIAVHVPAYASALAASVSDAGTMVAVLRDAVFFGNRGAGRLLDRKDVGPLVDFAAKSMGDEALQRFFAKLQREADDRGRSRILYRLAKRMRWELLRRARYFDHSVYGAEMGLRMLGTFKPNDDSSDYRPVGQKGRLTAKTIAAHSIRATMAKPSTPNRDFGEILRLAGVQLERQRPQPRSLEGMLMRGGLAEEIELADLEMTFQIKQRTTLRPDSKVKYFFEDARSPRKSSIDLEKVRFADQASSKFPGAQFPDHVIMAPDASTIVHGFPPRRKRSSTARTMASRAPSPASSDQIVIRVYIPSPIVKGPYGQDFAGDNRGESYGSGTSRLEVEVLIDRTTGAMSHQSYWGRTNGYDPDDTRPVPLKPSWWRDGNPGASPNGSATLQASPDNVNIGRTLGADGSTKVEVNYSGKNPLVALAPAIDGNISVTFNADGTVTVEARHDGFPAHTAYVNGQLVHAYDPELAGAGPTALFGSRDIRKRYLLPAAPSRPQPGQGVGHGGPFDRDDDADGLGDAGGDDDDRDDDGYDDGDPGAGGGGGGGSVSTGGSAGGDGQAGSGGTGAGDAGGTGNPAGGGASGGASSPNEEEPDGSQTLVVPVDLQTNADGTVTATVESGSPETFTYDPALGGWIGDGGSVLMGDQTMFGSEVHIEIVRDSLGNDTFYFCNADGCTAARNVTDTYGMQ